jgi:transketolase
MIGIDFYTLNKISKNVRKNILEMSNKGGAFVGSAFSCVELIVYLYKEYLNINKENLNSEHRDYFFLSKGHAVPALYGTFSEIGLLERDRLSNHLSHIDDIYWHPNTNIPGVEFHSGSLGHSIAIATGIALDCRNNNSNNKIVVMLGDGELNEGTIWETLQVASAYKLDNLIIIVDRNGIQANKRTEELLPLTPLNLKFESFGCSARSIDGHNFLDIKHALEDCPFETSRPSVIVADTIRGKGVQSIENKINKWFMDNDDYETLRYLNELYVTQEHFGD